MSSINLKICMTEKHFKTMVKKIEDFVDVNRCRLQSAAIQRNVREEGP